MSELLRKNTNGTLLHPFNNSICNEKIIRKKKSKKLSKVVKNVEEEDKDSSQKK